MTNINDINMGELIDKTRDTPKDGISVPGLPGWELHVPDDIEVDLNPNESIYWRKEVNGYDLRLTQVLIWDGDYSEVLLLTVSKLAPKVPIGPSDDTVVSETVLSPVTDHACYADDLGAAQSDMIKAAETEDWTILNKYKMEI